MTTAPSRSDLANDSHAVVIGQQRLVRCLDLFCGASRKRGASGDLNNAIPPAYSEFLGRHALAAIHSANDKHSNQGSEI